MESAEHYILPLPKLNPIPKILIIRAPYYKEIADDLLKGCTEMLEDAGIEWECIDVPGRIGNSTSHSNPVPAKRYPL